MLNRRKTLSSSKLRRGVSELITPPPKLTTDSRSNTFSPLRSPVSPTSSVKGSHSSNIKVVARFRPMNEYEKVIYK